MAFLKSFGKFPETRDSFMTLVVKEEERQDNHTEGRLARDQVHRFCVLISRPKCLTFGSDTG